MNILLVNQCFYPDVVAVSQYLTDLAVSLSTRGHSVTVLASNRAYDDPDVTFPDKQIWKGIKVIRVSTLGWGRKSKWLRIADFASFFLNCFVQICRIAKQDVVVAMTVPPLISIIAAFFVQLKGGRLIYWIMDLNPEEAIAAGWIRHHSFAAKALQFISAYSMRISRRVIVLDRFVKERIARKGIAEEKISVIPPWALDNFVFFDPAGRSSFRLLHGLEHKHVVMYSGNHSPCHPLDSLLEAALSLREQTEIIFCFVGGGSEFKKVKEFAREHHLDNIYCLSYQPLAGLSASLSAADLHVVVMGDAFVGVVHPCKIYNILAVGGSFLYIGPAEGHIPDLMAAKDMGVAAWRVGHGDVQSLVEYILDSASRTKVLNAPDNMQLKCFSQEVLLSKMVEVIELQP
jgi:colanic acid biosynthesis glycosyl transferase WcaI